MKKRICASISVAFLLSACGSQNLLPLEKRSTDLSDKNHEIKLENQQLKNENAKKQKQVDALKKDSENTKQAKSNQKKADYLEISSQYYASVTDAINAYQQIDSKVLANKKEDKVLDQLDQIIEDHESAMESYQDATEDEKIVKKDKSIKAQDKEIRKLQKEINSALTMILKGYKAKDKNEIQKGRQSLSNINVKTTNAG
ncbi:hypothetical protein O0D86_02185 [Staphylococcus pseudintermedius]|nr:coiled-coil domain-containing protein 22 [Staphylococcus pseudintermedius]EGQ3887347.1 hypothetical protein [Staphylococcus pseudintermedius]EGQ3914314.1 coiled-coil domain-containing protein 22 [Staphylococcus pseudintermedius]MDE9940250.1 hypothetical protein [Staphylococcus pseudintermedius]MDK3889208.1 hypothetical protein [Staphylococcus pseudintermedius]